MQNSPEGQRGVNLKHFILARHPGSCVSRDMQRTPPATPSVLLAGLLLTAALPCPAQQGSDAAKYTRLQALPAPKIVASAGSYPGGQHEMSNLLDGNPRTEYSSDNKGVNTFVEFDFGAPTELAGFRHVDRNDPATINTSELTLFDSAGSVIGTFQVKHPNKRGAEMFFPLPQSVAAQRARWRVAQLGSPHGTVGGAELVFYRKGQTEPTPSGVTVQTTVPQMLERRGNQLVQTVQVTLNYPYAEGTKASVEAEGAKRTEVDLRFGSQTAELQLPAVQAEKVLRMRIVAGPTAIQHTTSIKPVRKLDIYVLPHSHVDIGYTALQADVEKKQDNNLQTGMRLARETASYPEGSRFKWNVEVLWPVDNYLRKATPSQRQQFINAVKTGQVGLDALYCNILTGLSRPEELLNLMRYATQLSDICGMPIESAMISDVPGYTWSTVAAMAEAGVKYFSFAPNYFDRMGGTMKEWQNRPFWWQSADGRQRVLCWCPSRGYALGHIIGDGEALARFLPSYLQELETNSYPYDVTHLRWNVHGDNGAPDEKVADVVRDWNARYVYPRLIISTTAEAFREFERRYGKDLPQFSGDYTPYWEDGAASSARETALNRASAERLTQAETIWAMRNPGPFPAGEFQEAWRNVLLYSEHTWGAHNSISQPDIPFVRDQWKVKQAFALDADRQSRELLEKALRSGGAEPGAGYVDVLNTLSWDRTDIVTLSPELTSQGERVLDDNGKAVLSQRLSTGELVFLARNVPAFGARRYRVASGVCPSKGNLKVDEKGLESGDFRVSIDEQTGAIKSLYGRKLRRELTLTQGQTALNDFFYLPGANLKDLKRNAVSRIIVKERGPVLVSLLVTSEAPGCRTLSREIRLFEGLDRVEMINTIDKLPIRSKEGIHFGYGFNVPGGMPRFDVGLAAVRPELDQIPASCKNWFSVQRWVDISNDKFGVTWSPLDAPLVQLGSITANLVGSQTDHRVWVQHLDQSSTIYAWVMNNHWHTNYRADQEGPTVFRFAIRAHGKFAADEAARFGTSYSQPLVVSRASDVALTAPRLRLSTDKVVVVALKPADDGKGSIVRLFGASGAPQSVKLAWLSPAPAKVWLSDTSEKAKQPAGKTIEVPSWGVVTVRAE
jgi:hypothetical protein